MRFTETDTKGNAVTTPELPSETSGGSNLKPRIAILLCTYNGGPYLKEQLESFALQTYTNWTLYVSDDASVDDTRKILANYQQSWGPERLVIFDGPCRGFAENFISLVRRTEVTGDYFAFSDQDDIWFTDKLERSLTHLARSGSAIPALYCSRTRLVDANKNVLGLSPLFVKRPSFPNALVQSIAGANTMLINGAARDLLLKLPAQVNVVAHDWLTYMLVTGSGGRVFYDAVPTLDYRQHGGNLIGANAGVREKLARLRKMFQGRFAKWTDLNLEMLNSMKPLLTKQSVRALNDFETGRTQGLIKRIFRFRKSGVYRQTFPGNLSLLLAVLLGKI